MIWYLRLGRAYILVFRVEVPDISFCFLSITSPFTTESLGSCERTMNNPEAPYFCSNLVLTYSEPPSPPESMRYFYHSVKNHLLWAMSRGTYGSLAISICLHPLELLVDLFRYTSDLRIKETLDFSTVKSVTTAFGCRLSLSTHFEKRIRPLSIPNPGDVQAWLIFRPSISSLIGNSGKFAAGEPNLCFMLWNWVHLESFLGSSGGKE